MVSRRRVSDADESRTWVWRLPEVLDVSLEVERRGEEEAEDEGEAEDEDEDEGDRDADGDVDEEEGAAVVFMVGEGVCFGGGGRPSAFTPWSFFKSTRDA